MFERDPWYRACVLLFTKPSRPGRVKTRLIGELSAEQTAELHAAFLGDIETALSPGDFELRIAWALESDEPLPEAPARLARLNNFRQRGEDLGARLFLGLQHAAEKFDLVAAIGSDSPEIRPEILADAFSKLEDGTDVVLGPTRDGGYYLIATRRDTLRRELFRDIAWSTESVLQQTQERCHELGYSIELLVNVDDVDVADDLDRLAWRLATRTDEGPTRTRALLKAWGKLPEVAEEELG